MAIWLSENFTLGELEYSDTAIDNGWSNTAPKSAIVRMTLVAQEVQKIRDYINQAVKTLSGYRSPKVNRAVGGAAHSLHQIGAAMDCRATGISNAEFIGIAQKLEIPFEKIIDELPHSKTGGWTHIQLPRSFGATPKKEVWLWNGQLDDNGKPIYERQR